MMNTLLQMVTLTMAVSPAAAFFSYIPSGHPGAPRKIHASDAISKAFAFSGPNTPMKDSDKLQKAPWKTSITKRSVPQGTRLAKRVNDFKIEANNDPSQKNSAAIDQDGTDFSYFAEVSIDGNTVYMLLDTGSSAMWVMGKNCQSDACHTHALTSSGSNTDQTFSISYNSGDVTGNLAQNKMSFAGIDVDVTLGLATSTSDDFDKYPMDGILGLARSSSGTDFGGPTFLETLKNAKALPANVFGVWLDRAGSKNGEINFGAPDQSRYSGQLNFIQTDMDDTTIWKIPADDILVDGKSSGLSSRSAVIDTGTTYMFVPPKDAAAIYANIKGATPGDSDMYNIPCTTTANISVVLNRVSYQVSPKDYVGPSVGNGMCYSHIIANAAVNGDESSWLLGDTFLKNVYTVFDADDNRIGFGLPVQAETDDGAATGTAVKSSSTSSGDTSGNSAPPSDGMVGGSQPSGTAPAGATSTGKSASGNVGGSQKGDDGDAMGSIGDNETSGAASLGAGRFGILVVAAAVALLL